MFEQMYTRLENDLGVKRKDMAKLIDEVSLIYKDRDLVIQKLQQFQAKRDAFLQQQIQKNQTSDSPDNHQKNKTF